MTEKINKNLPTATIELVKSIIALGIRYECLSLGGGFQSSTLWLMNMMGLITPRAEFACFVDTGWERERTYEYLDYLDTQAEQYGFPPILRLGDRNIRDDMLDETRHHYDTPPFWVDSGKKKAGNLSRSCTGYYKISVMRRELRKIFGMKPRVQWIGFDISEVSRRNDSNFPQYIRPRYPLMEMRMNRTDCLEWLEQNGHPLPVKSACIGCPNRKDAEWVEMRETSPKEWDDVVEFSKQIETLKVGRKPVTTNQLTLFELTPPSYNLYLHRSRKTLDQVEFNPTHDDHLEQSECQGGCFT